MPSLPLCIGSEKLLSMAKTLKEVELIQGDKRGKWVYYLLVTGRDTEIKGLLDTILKVPLLVQFFLSRHIVIF